MSTLPPSSSSTASYQPQLHPVDPVAHGYFEKINQEPAYRIVHVRHYARNRDGLPTVNTPDHQTYYHHNHKQALTSYKGHVTGKIRAPWNNGPHIMDNYIALQFFDETGVWKTLRFSSDVNGVITKDY